jgi:transcriptional regulator with XRE-family HTH domain
MERRPREPRPWPQALQISQSLYSRLEQGQSAMSVSQLRVIAAQLHIPLGDSSIVWSIMLSNFTRMAYRSEEKPASPAGVLIEGCRDAADVSRWRSLSRKSSVRFARQNTNSYKARRNRRRPETRSCGGLVGDN